MRPDEQVLGVDAGWSVAAVQNVETVRHRSEVKLPGQAMGKDER